MLMGELYPLATPPCVQAHPQHALETDDPKFHSSDTVQCESAFITHIRATRLLSSLRRIQKSCYVSVAMNGKITKTSSHHEVLDKDTVGWDEEILLPAEQSSVISFKVYASSELGTNRGKGILLHQFKATVRDLLNHDRELRPIRFLSQEILPSCLTLGVTIERHFPTLPQQLPESDTTSQLVKLTGTGNRAFLRYRQLHNQKDLNEAITCFEAVRDMCPADHPNHSAVLFNLATAKFTHCRDYCHYFDLDVPITLYQDALQLRGLNHPYQRITAIDLFFALLARIRRQDNKADRMGTEGFLSGVAEGYAYDAAWLALQMAGTFMSPRAMQSISPANPEYESARKTRATLLDLPRWDPRRCGLMASLGELLYGRFDDTGYLVALHEAILAMKNAVQLIPNGHPNRPDLLNLLGVSLSRRFECLGDPADIHSAISTFEEVVRLSPHGHSDRPVWLKNFGKSLSSRFDSLGDIIDINKSISVFGESVRLSADSDPEKPARLGNLGNSLLRRFERLGDLADINQSISTLEEMARLISNGDPDKPARLCNLGSSLICRFKRLGNYMDLDRSISVFEEAICFTPSGHPDRPSLLSNIGSSLSSRFERLDDLADIHKSISMLEEAVFLAPSDHLMRPAWLANLGYSLFCRFLRLGNLADINRSISVGEEAVRCTPSGHPDGARRLTNLGKSLSGRFERLGDSADINRAISVAEEAVRLSPGAHPERPAGLNNLGDSLMRRFQRFGDLKDLSKSISMFEEAVHITPDGHFNKSAWLNNLGVALSRRFECLGSLADINKAILVSTEAVQLIPSDHPTRSGHLNNLANLLLRRSEHIDDLADVNMYISMQEEAVRLTPNNHPDKPARLNNLGNSLCRRFERVGNIEDIDNSISMQESSIRLIPDSHPEKPTLLKNFGFSLLLRFDRIGDPADANKSILVTKEAVSLTPNTHPDRPAALNNLGNSYSRRFRRLGNHADVSSSISAFEEAVCLIPNGHPSKPGCLNNLGNAYVQSFAYSLNPSDLCHATLHFSEASHALAGPTFARFDAACRWIFCARLEGSLEAVLDACATAIDLLPQLAWLGLPLTERHRALLGAADVVRDAAAAALEAGCPEKAVQWLEQGRSIVWSQFLQLRTPVDELFVKHPTLAHRFQQISKELEHSSSRDNITPNKLVTDPATSTRSLESEVQKHHKLAFMREELLTEIRSLPGFDRFLLPKTVEQITAFAPSAPVVYLNASKQRCDALIIRAKETRIFSLPLSGTNYLEVELLRRVLRLLLERDRLIISRDDISLVCPSEENAALQQFLDSLSAEHGTKTTDRAVKVKPQQIAGYTPDDLFRQVLARLWKGVVSPILLALGFSTPSSGPAKLPHIFWCPTGPFAFLPIHAAGLYSTAEKSTQLSDFAISSYIPTLGSLASSADREPNRLSSGIRLVVVPQPSTDGLTMLASVQEEIDHVRGLSAGSPLVTLQNSDGTIMDVMDKMKNADWVHFACHGVQDPHNPLDSGLCLADSRRLKLSDIIRMSRSQGGLAFLSACQTAQGDEKLADESVHLAAGMLLAGYGGVIATMWAIRDPDAPKVTKDVYGYLFRNGKCPDSTETAEALHYAIQHLRASGAPFTSWVPFIHVGR